MDISCNVFSTSNMVIVKHYAWLSFNFEVKINRSKPVLPGVVIIKFIKPGKKKVAVTDIKVLKMGDEWLDVNDTDIKDVESALLKKISLGITLEKEASDRCCDGVKCEVSIDINSVKLVQGNINSASSFQIPSKNGKLYIRFVFSDGKLLLKPFKVHFKDATLAFREAVRAPLISTFMSQAYKLSRNLPNRLLPSTCIDADAVTNIKISGGEDA